MKSIGNKYEIPFSDRMALSYCVKKALDHLSWIKANEKLPDYVTEERLQNLINELGGNVELNTTRYTSHRFKLEHLSEQCTAGIHDECIISTSKCSCRCHWRTNHQPEPEPEREREEGNSK